MADVKAAPRKGRPRLSDSPGLSQADIVQSAILLAQEATDTDINMRELAKLLNVTPKALYRYVSGKDELLDLAAQSLLEKLVFVPASEPWDVRLADIMTKMLTTIRQYPALAQPMLLRNLEARDSPDAAKIVAAIKLCLQEAGLTDSEVDDVFFLYVALVQGELAMAQAVKRGALSPASLPSQTEIDAKFATGLHYVIAGIMAGRH